MDFFKKYTERPNYPSGWVCGELVCHRSFFETLNLAIPTKQSTQFPQFVVVKSCGSSHSVSLLNEKLSSAIARKLYSERGVRKIGVRREVSLECGRSGSREEASQKGRRGTALMVDQ